MSEFYGDPEDPEDNEVVYNKVEQDRTFIVRYAQHGILQSSLKGENEASDFQSKAWEQYHHKGFLHIEFDPKNGTARIVPKSKL